MVLGSLEEDISEILLKLGSELVKMIISFIKVVSLRRVLARMMILRLEQR